MLKPIPQPKFFYVLLTLIVLIAIFFIFSLNSVEKDKSIEFTTYDVKPIKLKPLSRGYKDKIFNLTLHYVIDSSPCLEEDLLAVILVTSYYGNQETRSAMRRAFSSEDLAKFKLRRVFLLGEVKKDPYIKQSSIEDESRRFGDLIQGNFIEAYRNLTYKHLMGLKWASDHCFRAKYVIKMDDDIVINVPKIANLLNTTSFPTNLIAGYVLKQMTPIREPANKWYVTETEYKDKTYPPFVSGWFYVTTPRIASKFHLLSHYVDYFWIDDLYVTGILGRYLKIKHFDLKKYFTLFPEFLRCCMDGAKKRVDCDVLVGPNGGDSNLFFKFNRQMEVCLRNLCKERVKPLNETCVAERVVSIGKGSGAIENYKLR